MVRADEGVGVLKLKLRYFSSKNVSIDRRTEQSAATQGYNTASKAFIRRAIFVIFREN